MRRLRETQALLIKFSEENSRLSSDNQMLQAGRKVLGVEHASVLDEIGGAQLEGSGQSRMPAAAAADAAKCDQLRPALLKWHLVLFGVAASGHGVFNMPNQQPHMTVMSSLSCPALSHVMQTC